MSDEDPRIKINFVCDYPLDTRWSVIVSDFIDHLKPYFCYLTLKHVARKLTAGATLDRWLKYDPQINYGAHFREIVYADLNLDRYYKWVDSFELSLDERLGGYVGPRLQTTVEKEDD